MNIKTPSKSIISDIITHTDNLRLINEEMSEIINILDTNPEMSVSDKQNIIQHLVRDF